MRAYIVVDLGFGDAGKGLLTDFLVRQCNAGLVIRYNGGAQAGHNVVTADGCHHTFSQFGSGTFVPDVKTYLSRHIVVHPTALLLEGNVLEQKGVLNPFSRIRISDQALVITPFHQAANRIREIIRGSNRHGSCGVGVGEAVEDALLYPSNCIRAGDLNTPSLLRRKLQTIQKKKREQVIRLHEDFPNETAREFEVFERDDVIDIWISSIDRIRKLGLVVSDLVLRQWLRETDSVVFEGAQGVLLDEDAGFHPFTTWSRCTSANALEIINEYIPTSSVFRIGVMRSYALRHGPGPLPTETDELASKISEHNSFNEWQGRVRYGWFDMVLARYALRVTGGVDTLMITHMDILPHLKTWKYCMGYLDRYDSHYLPDKSVISNDVLKDLHVSPYLSVEQRGKITNLISSVTPVIKACRPNEGNVLRKIELLLGQSIGIVSRGPSAANVSLLKSISL